MNIARAQVAMRHRWLVLAVLVVVGPLVGAVVALTAPVHYRSTATVLISSNHIGSIDDLGSGNQLAINIAPSFVPVVTSAGVLSPVIAKLHLPSSVDELEPRLRVTLPLNGTTLTISGTATDRVASAVFVNAVADQFVVLEAALSPRLGTAPAFAATKIGPAYPPASDSGLRVAAGLSLGLLAALGLGWIVIAAYDSNPIVETRAGVARVTRARVVGVVPLAAEPARSLHVARARPAALTQAHGVARAALAVAAPQLHSVMVVATRSGDGSTTTAVGLAMSAAAASRRVLLIDANVRHPQLSEVLQLEKSRGLVELLQGKARLATVVQPVGDDGLHVIAIGQLAGRLVLSASAVGRLLTAATADYDLVVIDLAALEDSSDALELAACVDGIVVVVNARTTRQRPLASTLDSLVLAGGAVAGVVLNKVAVADHSPSGRSLVPHRDRSLRQLART